MIFLIYNIKVFQKSGESMYIGDLLQEYREANEVSIEDFAGHKSRL